MYMYHYVIQTRMIACLSDDRQLRARRLGVHVCSSCRHMYKGTCTCRRAGQCAQMSHERSDIVLLQKVPMATRSGGNTYLVWRCVRQVALSAVTSAAIAPVRRASRRYLSITDSTQHVSPDWQMKPIKMYMYTFYVHVHVHDHSDAAGMNIVAIYMYMRRQ